MDLYTFDRSIEDKCDCIVIGTDEVGRGPLAGPVMAAAVRLDLQKPIDGITDSKKLSAKKREILYDQITTEAIDWAVSEVSPKEIDRINILQASLKAMHLSIDQLSTPWSKVLVDGNKLINTIDSCKQKTVIKGDNKSASIAAASIIAKVTRDRLMIKYHDQYPEYGFNAHKGYPTAKHRECVKQYGITPIHRKTFCEKFLIQTELLLT